MLSRQMAWATACRSLRGSLSKPGGIVCGRQQSIIIKRALSSLPNSGFFRALQQHDPCSTAVVHSRSGRTFDYGALLGDVLRSKQLLLDRRSGATLAGERIAFLAENSYDYIVMLFSILAADAIAVPLSPAFPAAELRYILNQSEARMLLATEKFADKARSVVEEGIDTSPAVDVRSKIVRRSPHVSPSSITFENGTTSSRGGLMLYTSGTTNRPKGVLLPLSALEAQARSLIEAWKYSAQDRLLHVLPLHHIHGTVNALITPVLAGSSIEFLYPFNPDTVWRRLAAPFLETRQVHDKKITFLTAVPTLWTRLMETFPDLPANVQCAGQQAISSENLRLNISGSAALPTPTKTAWTSLSHGNVLLERYGMTEVGMAISCGLDPADRVDGSVGWPLPSVDARLWDADKAEVIQPGEELDKATGRERVGEIQLRGPTIFAEYFRNEKATADSFVAADDGKGPWFRTGDVAVRRTVPGAGRGASGSWAKGPLYFIQGRLSVDIIKTGGEKVSALEVERELLSLPEIREAAVVGLPSARWGQKVGAVVVLNKRATEGKDRPWSAMDVRRALKTRLAMYKLPQEVKLLNEPIPRNAMGKVNKKQLVREVFGVE